MVFLSIFTITVLIPELPVLKGNDPSEWRVIGFIYT
jgi:hypothetical protein